MALKESVMDDKVLLEGTLEQGKLVAKYSGKLAKVNNMKSGHFGSGHVQV